MATLYKISYKTTDSSGTSQHSLCGNVVEMKCFFIFFINLGTGLTPRQQLKE